MPTAVQCLIAALAFAVGTWGAAAAQTPPRGERLAPFPATWIGTLPCADCPGIEITLDLRGDGVFFLRRDYLERGAFDEIGRWTVAGDDLTLTGTEGEPLRFRLADTGDLRMLDREGRAIESELNYALARQDACATIEPELPMRGMFLYLADAARFRECATGLDLPVAMEADYLALERAYLADRPAPGEPLLVSLTGSIVPRPAMEGPGAVDTLRVETFSTTRPGEDCPAP
jgi:uncharacterized lipoprotein NlpE involved in copper resistance